MTIGISSTATPLCTLWNPETWTHLARRPSCVWACAAFVMALAATAHAQPVNTSITETKGRVTIVYDIHVVGVPKADVRIHLPTSDEAEMTAPTAHGCADLSNSKGGGAVVVTCSLIAEKASVSLTVTGDAGSLDIDSTSQVSIHSGDSHAFVPNVQTLKAPERSPSIQAVFGGGIGRRIDDSEDFIVKNDTLLVLNDSLYRPTALAGALFRLGSVHRHEVGLHSSLQFAEGGALLDGFSLGLAWSVNDSAHLTAGMLLQKGKELSKGFKRAAIDAATAAAVDSALARYAGFNGHDADLDGLPLKVGDKAWYPGDAIVDSYNWSFYVGVVVPVRISELFGAKAKKE